MVDGYSLALCSTTVSVVSAGICHRNKVNSIAWLYRKAQPKDSIIYITLHYIIIYDSIQKYGQDIILSYRIYINILHFLRFLFIVKPFIIINIIFIIIIIIIII